MNSLLYLNNTIPQTINFNGAEVKSVYYNYKWIWGDVITDNAKDIAREKNALVLTSTESLSFVRTSSYGSKTWDGILQYSLDCGETWITMGSQVNIEAPLINGQYILCLRGKGNTVIIGPNNDCLFYGPLIQGNQIRCVGNIETLLDYETVAAGEHPLMATDCFRGFFANTNLIEAPELPSPIVPESAYMFMFHSSTITRAPKLLATDLGNFCYSDMFADCVNLVEPPEILPATVVSSSAYFNMFIRCSNLTTVPKILGTTFYSSSCYQMFKDCANLTTLPDLTMVEAFYPPSGGSCTEMFYGCSKIKISKTKTDECPNEYRIGNENTKYQSYSFKNMFGSLTPTPNVTYYTNATII